MQASIDRLATLQTLSKLFESVEKRAIKTAVKNSSRTERVAVREKRQRREEANLNSLLI